MPKNTTEEHGRRAYLVAPTTELISHDIIKDYKDNQEHKGRTKQFWVQKGPQGRAQNLLFGVFASEYLKYLDLKESSGNSYIGLSFIVKNLLIIIVTISYLYFYFFLGKATKSIENSQMNIKKNKDLDQVDSLDYFLNEDEINKKN